jgi:hypothetical protein
VRRVAEPDADLLLGAGGGEELGEQDAAEDDEDDRDREEEQRLRGLGEGVGG